MKYFLVGDPSHKIPHINLYEYESGLELDDYFLNRHHMAYILFMRPFNQEEWIKIINENTANLITTLEYVEIQDKTDDVLIWLDQHVEKRYKWQRGIIQSVNPNTDTLPEAIDFYHIPNNDDLIKFKLRFL